MKKIDLPKTLLLVCLVLLIISVVVILSGSGASSGFILIGLFIILSLEVKGFEAIKGLSFTMWIFAAGVAVLFYPQLFVQFGNFKTTLLIVPLLQIIMFGIGSQMSFQDFAGMIKMPKGVLVGFFGHYLIMPLTAVIVVRFLNLPTEVAAGVILIGCVPNGLASNVMSLLCNAKLVLAVAISAVTIIVAPFVTPFLMKFLGGQYIEINVWSMMMDIMQMMIFPIIAGFIFNLINTGNTSARKRNLQLVYYAITIMLANLIYWHVNETGFTGYLIVSAKSLVMWIVLPVVLALLFRYYLKGDLKLQKKILSMLSMVGIVVIVAVITAAGQETLITVGGVLLLIVTMQKLLGYFLGYNAGRLFKLQKLDCRTLAFEVSMSNGGLASGLALTIGNIATVGLVPANYGPLMNVTGSTLASYWRTRPVSETEMHGCKKKTRSAEEGKEKGELPIFKLPVT